jgi:hypothetical protein
LSAIERIQKKMDVQARLLLSINRSETKEQALETTQLAIQYMDRGVVGIDLSGNPHVRLLLHWIVIGLGGKSRHICTCYTIGTTIWFENNDTYCRDSQPY